MGLSFVLVAVGLGIGLVGLYAAAWRSGPDREKAPLSFVSSNERMWLDELYGATIIAVARFAARFSDWLDRYVWDGFVAAVAGIGQLLRHYDRAVR